MLHMYVFTCVYSDFNHWYVLLCSGIETWLLIKGISSVIINVFDWSSVLQKGVDFANPWHFLLKLTVSSPFEEIRECGDDMTVIVSNFGNGGCRPQL